MVCTNPAPAKNIERKLLYNTVVNSLQRWGDFLSQSLFPKHSKESGKFGKACADASFAGSSLQPCYTLCLQTNMQVTEKLL